MSFPLKKQFLHPQPSSSTGIQSNSSITFCLKLSIENLVPSQSSFLVDENSELCLNLFLLKDNLAESYYLCENAFFPLSKVCDSDRANTTNDQTNPGLSSTSFSQKNYIEKCALFCDISEKVLLLF